jgi:Fe-S cluster assembly protein SufD
MTGTAAILDRARLAGAPAGDPAGVWLRDHGMPTAEDEAWRYAPLDRILGHEPVEAPTLSAVDRPSVAAAGDHGGARLVLVDGVFSSELSDLSGHTDGLRVDWRSNRGRSPGARYDGFQAWNRLVNARTAEIHVAPGARIQHPVHVVHVTTAANGADLTMGGLRHEAKAPADSSHVRER